VSIYHGAHGLMHPAPLHDVWASLSVIGISMLVESYSLFVAMKALQTGAAARSMSLRTYFLEGLDPIGNAVVAEDGGAVLGLALAGSCLLAAGGSGNPVFDSLGSVAVGSLLGGVAGWLIQTNRRALVGRSLKRLQLEALLAALRADDVVADVVDAKSEEIAPGVFRFKIEISFCGTEIVRRYLAEPALRAEVAQRFTAATAATDGRALDEALAMYGRGLIQTMGAEVDRLEVIVKRVEPSIVHVDIEVRARPATILFCIITQVPLRRPTSGGSLVCLLCHLECCSERALGMPGPRSLLRQHRRRQARARLRRRAGQRPADATRARAA